jgi:hypothetical protein
MIEYIAPPAPSAVTPVLCPTFSVVIAAYNAADVIGNAINSVLAQTLAPHEIIVCNDGSTDELHNALAIFDDRIKVIEQENGGEASAKNTGIRAARGDFVAILDPDDVYLPRRLQALAELSQRRPDLDLLTTDAYLTVRDTYVRRCFAAGFEFPVAQQREAILRFNFLPFVVARRQAVLAAGGFDEELRDIPDWDLWLRMILSGSRAGLITEPLAEYRLTTSNTTSDRTRVHRGKVATLEKTAGRSDLSPREQVIVNDGVAFERRELLLSSARDALRSGDPRARRLCAGIVKIRDIGLRARTGAFAAALAPRVARRALARRDAKHGVEITGGVRVDARTGQPKIIQSG